MAMKPRKVKKTPKAKATATGGRQLKATKKPVKKMRGGGMVKKMRGGGMVKKMRKGGAVRKKK